VFRPGSAQRRIHRRLSVEQYRLGRDAPLLEIRLQRDRHRDTGLRLRPEYGVARVAVGRARSTSIRPVHEACKSPVGTGRLAPRGCSPRCRHATGLL